MKKLTGLFLLLFSLSTMIFAQSENLNVGIIKGQLLSIDNQPVAYASVSLFDTDEKLLLGTISEEDGTFLLEKVALDTVILDVQFLGYQTYRKELILNRKVKKINLESVLLEEDAKQLEEVVITAEKSKYSLQLDKKVFEVGKDAMSQGGSALEVLEQVPLVTVEPSGSVSLRGSSAVQILINGKRSGLTMNNALDQIPSDNIERVEVITNPSASFDASGSAGIINIILKKNKGEGWNGQIGLRTGTPADHSVSPGINYRGKKINFFSNLRWRYSDYIGRYKTEQQTFSDGNTSFLSQNENENRHDDGRSGYFGADYYFDEQNSITLAYFRAETKDTDLTLLNYNLEDGSGGKNDFLRTGNSVEERNYNQIEANYTHEFLTKGEKLTFDFQYDFWNSDKDWSLATRGDFLPANVAQDLRTNNKAGSRDYVLQTDYKRPLKNGNRIEIGGKFENRIVKNEYIAESLIDDTWTVFNNIDNDVDYSERIGDAYLQYAGKAGKAGKIEYSLGLRSEYTLIDIEDRESEFTDNNNYLNIFPSANLGYKMSESNSIQLSYSKRINRPSLWALYPFSEITDYNFQSIGNPNLQPAFSDAFEISYLLVGEKITLNPNVYYKNINDSFQDFIERDAQETFISKPINIEQRNEAGLEVSLRYSPAKFLRLNSEFNYYGFAEKGNFQGVNLDANGQAWRARVSADFRLPKGINLQSRFNYWSSEKGAQTTQLSTYVLSFAGSKDFFGDKLNVSFRAYNVLDSRARRSITETESFIIERDGRRNKARYGLGIVYRFNQSSRDRMRRENRGNR